MYCYEAFIKYLGPRFDPSPHAKIPITKDIIFATYLQANFSIVFNSIPFQRGSLVLAKVMELIHLSTHL